MLTDFKKQAFVWETGFCNNENSTPDSFVKATVPGTVQADWAQANGWVPYWQEHDVGVYGWMEDVYWLYRTQFDVPRQNTAILCFKGIDYRYRITLNGEVLCDAEGMYTEHRFDISHLAGSSCTLEVLLWPIPKAPIIFEGRDQAKESCKPAVSYGWDFHPRLVPTGLWGDVYLECGASTGLISCAPQINLSEDLSEASIDARISVSRDTKIAIELLDATGQTVAQTCSKTESGQLLAQLNIEKPRLWWPTGFGEQYLYTLKVLVDESKTCVYEKKIGFRRVCLNMNEGEWAYPNEFPKSRSTAPITMTVNGVRLFAKGSNWVPPDVFPALITDDTYRQLLTLVRDANMNILRVWGGGAVNREIFFELCDQMGIMVWQEFPLACNCYPDKPSYLSVLEKEATSLIERLRVHPCLVLWCGGNELFNCWSGMTDQSHALRLLNKLCYEYDRNTPFMMTSPLFGIGHGHYRFMDTPNKEFITSLIDKTNTAYTEFGVPGCNSLSYIYQYGNKNDFDACSTVEDMKKLLPFYNEPVMRKFSEDALQYFYGEIGSPEQIVQRLSMLQGIYYKTLFEEMRKQWPRCSMAINWCFNAPWPLICNENLVDWPCVPKPAYLCVKSALRGKMASLRVRKHAFDSGSEFEAQLWMLNDTLDSIPPQNVKVVATYGNIKKVLLDWRSDETHKQSNQQGPSVFWKLPEYNGQETFDVELLCENKEYDSSYQYIIRPTEEQKKALTLNGL